MADTRGAKRFVGQIAKALAKRLPERNATIGATFAEDLFGNVEPEDLKAYRPEVLAGFAEQALDLLGKRRPGERKVRLVDPPEGPLSGEPITLIEMLNDDMPFLVDSSLLVLGDFGADIRLVAHPVVRVSRNAEGEFVGLGADDGRPESLIHIHVDRMGDADDRAALVERLETLLADIHRAVRDWRAMLDRLAAIIAEYKTKPLPVSEQDRAETIAFLEWLDDDNFTFLGFRDYDFSGGQSRGRLKRSAKPGLGILADPDIRVLTRGGKGVTMTPEIRAFLTRPEPLIVTKSNQKTRVHRAAYADYVGVKRYHDDGRLAGELRFVGLFTSTAYTQSIMAIPYLRGKAEAIIARAGFRPHSRSGRALANALEAFPRDEFFQSDLDYLYSATTAIVALSLRPRVRVLVRRDRFDRFVSVLVFVPRDRYDSTVRRHIGDYLAETFDGHISAFYPTFLEGLLTRVQYIIGRTGGATPNPDTRELEDKVGAIIERWPDALAQAIEERFEPEIADDVLGRYGEAFPVGYQHAVTPEQATDDIASFLDLGPSLPLTGSFRAVPDEPPSTIGLKLAHLGSPLPLSTRVPVLENMGLRVIDEQTFDVEPAGDHPPIFVHDMVLEHRHGHAVKIDDLGPALIACFLAVWDGRAEDDGYNTLVIDAGLTWREAAILRTASRYIRQSGTPFTNVYMWETLIRHAEIARALVDVFFARFDPAAPDERLAKRRVQKIEAALDSVESLDEDRIIRMFLGLFGAILRTNYFKRSEDGAPLPTISFKIESRKLDFLPLPRPLREIFVYSPRVEGVHLRFGMVARGGLRWSDRPLDFRTEVLGLAKAQEVKNAVIIPRGAKGGFVPKRLPEGGDRAAFLAEGTAAYRIFISSLLDITDNLVVDEPVHPDNVLTRDGDDPYLVVAADKGTATFSDTANAIAEARDFWLGDAFASGGSHGYDHKKMGITARGAWESVKRHFREIDIDIQTTPFTAVGVGDMSGDVFGNGMLLSEQTRLVAAFDHRDIFIDPDPDPARSHAERKRLFETPQTTWQSYDKRKISKGGGVFSRKEKAIPLSPEIRALLDLEGETAPPNKILRAILTARADLLFFGGIGTYVRAKGETNDQVGDRANDAIRIRGSDLRVKVVGEGANLGMTQQARIEYALAGGRCNSDAIDNSAGVNTSDVEVNIKIALGRAVRDGRLDAAGRDRLLVRMTDEVAALVLRNNYLQTLAISMTASRGMADFGFHRRLIIDLERRGVLDRAVEFLPDDATLDERQTAGMSLTRPEIGVLLAYAKIVLSDDLMRGNVADHATLSDELLRYFPETMVAQFGEDIEAHRLRSEIIATQVANSIINRGGPSFVIQVEDRTGASSVDIARTYVAVREAFQLRHLNDAINALDNRVSGAIQLALYRAVQDITLSRTIWFLRNAPLASGQVAAVAEAYRGSIEALADQLDGLLTEESSTLLADTITEYSNGGVPEDLATDVARLRFTADATDIHLVAQETGKDFSAAADIYYALSHRFRIDRALRLASVIPMADYYDGLARDRAVETMAGAHRQLAVHVINAGGLEAWEERHRAALDRGAGILAGMTGSEDMTLSRAIVVANLLADVART